MPPRTDPLPSNGLPVSASPPDPDEVGTSTTLEEEAATEDESAIEDESLGLGGATALEVESLIDCDGGAVVVSLEDGGAVVVAVEDGGAVVVSLEDGGAVVVAVEDGGAEVVIAVLPAAELDGLLIVLPEAAGAASEPPSWASAAPARTTADPASNTIPAAQRAARGDVIMAPHPGPRASIGSRTKPGWFPRQPIGAGRTTLHAPDLARLVGP